jgi:Bacterial antitoxin of type II TA system, VapB
MCRCMRTTINLDGRLLAEAKLLAQRSGKTLTAIIEDALRERLARRSTPAPCDPTRLPTVGGNGLLPGVDLDNSATLRDLMDAAS